MNHKRLKQLRLDAGLTLTETADFLDIHTSSLNLYEEGRRTIPHDLMQDIYTLFRLGRYNKRGFSKDSKEYQDLKETRRKILREIDFKYGSIGKTPEDCELFQKLRKAYNVEIRQKVIPLANREPEVVRGIFYTKD